MTREQIEQLAARAGFKLLPGNNADRLVFTRNASALMIGSNGAWTFYTDISNGDPPDTTGRDHESLVRFLDTKLAKSAHC